ncbi:hypothetical protein KP001_16340 [Geomonas subterranea]|uniref:Uncharacterized protein n=1 Tax=Geomonas subterranea TaxID=2847989 RepID=A0ABX8LD60_9BACT|nr:hypothetical protein [Geomonas subterranea]QXE89975.1 hypothetical protein KP001_16340 [Geomonas subterranea]QXM07905.1 hypothetical protein KP002_12940 [Geomonas subterranea]
MEQVDELKFQLEGVKERIRAVQEQRSGVEQILATVDKRVSELEGSQAMLENQIQDARAEIASLTSRYADGEPVEKNLHRLKATFGTLETKLSTVTSALAVARSKREEPVRQIAQIEKTLKHEQEQFWRLVYEVELTKTIPQVLRLLYAAKGGACSASSLGWLGFYPEDVEQFFVRKFYDSNMVGSSATIQAAQQQLVEEYGSPSGEEAKTGLFSKLFKS